jgi:hypothetical protein
MASPPLWYQVAFIHTRVSGAMLRRGEANPNIEYPNPKQFQISNIPN